MKTTLSAQEMPLHKVFSDDYLFTIPPVQRPYSWTTDESGELLDDLLNFMEYYQVSELTTLTILLAVLRDFLGGKYAIEIDEMIVQIDYIVKGFAKAIHPGFP